MESPGDSLAAQVFLQRKEQLLLSLENVFSKIATDRFIHQMFHDNNSAVYIPTRVCELVKFYLNDDREQYIASLLKKLKAFEACFGSDRAKEIEEVGARLLDVTNSQMKKENEYRKAIQDLKQQLKLANNEIFSQTVSFEDAGFDIKEKVSGVLRSNREYLTDVKNAHVGFLRELRRMRKLARKAVGGFQAKAESYEKEINELKEQHLQDLNESKAQMEEAEEKIEKIKERQQQVQEQHQDEVEKLEKALQEKEEEIEQLQEDNEGMKNQIVMLEEEVANLSEEVASAQLNFDSQVMPLFRQSSREIVDAQRSLNINQAQLRNTKEYNEELQREIDEKDQKIQEMTDDILEKDKQISQLTQSNQKQTKMCESLQAITKKHEEEVDNLRKEILKLQDENMELKSAVDLTTSGLGASEQDIDAKFGPEREKYRAEITKLQKTIADQSIQITDQGRTIDKLTFERDSLSRQISDKENEVSFVKDRTAKDLQEIRGTILKTMEENGDLRRKRVEAEELTKSLMRQLEDVGSVEEIPAKLWKMRQENNELKAQMESLQKLCGDDNVGEYIASAKKKCAELETWQASVMKATNGADIADVPTLVANQMQELAKLQEKMEGITGVIGGGNEGDMVEAVAKSKGKLDAFEAREQQIAKALGGGEFADIPSKIAELVRENSALKAKEERVDALEKEIRAQDPSFKFEKGSIKGMIESANELEAIKSILPAEVGDNPRETVQKLVTDNQKHEELENKLQRILGGHGDASGKKTLDQVAADLVKENHSMKSEIDRIRDELPDELKGEDLPKTISSLVARNLDLEAQRRMLADSLSGGGGDLAAQVKALIKECADLRAFKQRMAEIAHTDDNNEIVMKARDLFNQAVEIAEALDHSKNPIDDINKLKEENQAAQMLIDKLKKVMECDEDKLIQMIQKLKADFEATGKFFVECLKVMTGSANLKVRFPPPPQVKSRLIGMIQEFRQKMNEAHYAIKEIIARAQRAGYTETDPIGAVEFLQEVSAFNARQKFSEEVHDDISALRALNKKMHDLSDKQKRKYKTQIIRYRQQISDFQETIIRNEEEKSSAILEAKNSVRESEVQIEAETRLRDELLRAMVGDVYDDAFIKGRLPPKQRQMYIRFTQKQS